MDNTELKKSHLCFAFEFLRKVVDEMDIGIFSIKMGTTSSDLDIENLLLNSKKGDITFASNFLVETVGDRSS